jgi:serine protease Do
MKAFNLLLTTALFLGLAMFVAVGMLMLSGVQPTPDRLQPVPYETSVAAPAEQLGQAFAMVAAHVRPSVVSVFSEKSIKYTEPDFSSPFGDDFLRHFFGEAPSHPQAPRPHERRSLLRGQGSGIIIDREGRILTNYHVVSDVTEIKVQLPDKRIFPAEVVGTDPKTDVAVIKIKGAVPADLPPATLGDSDAAHVGHLVLAIGAPFGLAQTVTNGIISATGRSDVGIAGYEDFLQTDAPINQGNSGGPLVNMRGEVIGINSAIAITSSQGQFAGVGFAIPSNMVKTMLPKLLKGEKIVRGQLGVVIQNVTNDLGRQFGLQEPRGVLVAQANPDSPAAKAGIKAGDIILRYEGREAQDVHSLRNMVAATPPGTSVKIDILRNGKEQPVTVKVGILEAQTTALPPSAESSNMSTRFGLEVQTLTPEIAKQLGVEGTKGAVINEVADGSLASLAGLTKGDLITEADHQPVTSAEDFAQIVDKAKDKDELLLNIKRKDASLFVVLQTK